MEHVAERGLSQPLMHAQRSCATLLDRSVFDAADAFAARRTVGALERADHIRLVRWLAWQSVARNPQALTRIERLDARLAASVLHARGQLPAYGRPKLSEGLRRTA
ncbi:MAG: hypothetical protein ABI411_16635 [Tahibacter sp.]